MVAVELKRTKTKYMIKRVQQKCQGNAFLVNLFPCTEQHRETYFKV